MVRFEVGVGLLKGLAELQQKDLPAWINDGLEPVKGSEVRWQRYCLEWLSIFVLAVIKQTDFNRLTRVLFRILLALLCHVFHFFIVDSDEKSVTDLLDALRLGVKDVPVFCEVGPGELLFLLEVGHLEREDIFVDDVAEAGKRAQFKLGHGFEAVFAAQFDEAYLA